MENYLKNVTEGMKKLRPDLIKYPYSCFEEFVLKNGKKYTNHTIRKIKRGKMKNCFMNAYHYAENQNLTYVEGYASSSIGFPVLHAWCVDELGVVYDPTWKDGKKYFGVAFDMKYVNQIILQRRAYGVIDNIEGGFPLITGEHKNFKKEGR